MIDIGMTKSPPQKSLTVAKHSNGKGILIEDVKEYSDEFSKIEEAHTDIFRKTWKQLVLFFPHENSK